MRTVSRIGMRLLLLGFAGVFLSRTTIAEAQNLPRLPEGKKWRMIWNDEFDGSAIDNSKWNVSPLVIRDKGFWSNDNVYLDGKGHIIFKATRRGNQVVGAGIDTYRKFSTSGGYFAFRCTLATLPGYRPAIWLTTPSVERVGDEGRDGTEIDVFEQPVRNGRVDLNLHWDGYGKDHKTTGIKFYLTKPLSEWHDFGLWWKADEYIFFVDGKIAWVTKDGGVSQVDQIIKIAIEVPWFSDKFQRSEFGEEDFFMCDYARVFKEEQDR